MNGDANNHNSHTYKSKAMSFLAISLSFKNTQELLRRFSSQRAVMLRGRHGIGKSEGVYQASAQRKVDFYKDADNCRRVSEALRNDSGFNRMLASFWKKNDKNPAYADLPRNVWHYDMGRPVVERRLSQMTEGDITGLPFEGCRGGTVFRSVEWLLATCEFPCTLFLDELNRAIKGVEQATFQLADSKAFDGNRLHADTQVIVAVNLGDEYDVQSMDPAALSRYAVIDLAPTVDEAVEYYADNCNEALSEFIRANARYLEVEGTSEPNKKTPDRRAWFALDSELTASGLYDTPESPVFLHMAASMVGFEAAAAYQNHCKDRASDITAEELLANPWSKTEKRLPKDDSKRHLKFVDLHGKLEHLLKTRTLTPAEAKNLAGFVLAAPPELLMVLWRTINLNNNIAVMHSHVAQRYVEVLGNQSGAKTS